MTTTRRRTWRLLLTAAGVFAGAAGWSILLWPPVQYYYSLPQISVWDVFLELLKPINNIYRDGFAIGWIFLGATFVLAFLVPVTVLRIVAAALKYIENSEVDVSLLQINLTMRWDEKMEIAASVREQLLHANRPGLTAYHYNQTVDTPNGKIDPLTFEMTSVVDGDRITEDFIIRATPRSFEAIELFKRALPTNFWATYLPDWFILIVWNHIGLFKKVIVRRNGQINIANEHNGEDATVSLNSLKRCAKRVTLTLDFPEKLSPRQQDMKCFIIRDNVVSSIYPVCTTHGQRRVYSAYVGELDHASLRFQWNNRRLHDSPAMVGIDPASASLEHQAKAGLIRRLGNGLSRLTRGDTASPTIDV